MFHKTRMKEEFKEVPPLEFSRLGYSRKRPIASSSWPAGRLPTHCNVHKTDRVNDAEPRKSIVRSNSEANFEIEAKNMPHSNRDVNAIGNSRLRRNSESPNMRRRYFRRSQSPNISRQKAVQRARDDIMNQLKTQNSRASSRARPPLR